jgi:hypothetical protein
MENYERDRLGLEEFFNEVLYLVSRKIVSEQYLEENEDFINSFITDLYDAYLEGCTIKVLSDIVENMLYSMFKYKPGLKNI